MKLYNAIYPGTWSIALSQKKHSLQCLEGIDFPNHSPVHVVNQIKLRQPVYIILKTIYILASGSFKYNVTKPSATSYSGSLSLSLSLSILCSGNITSYWHE